MLLLTSLKQRCPHTMIHYMIPTSNQLAQEVGTDPVVNHVVRFKRFFDDPRQARSPQTFE
jgi:hypothetical protein